MGRSNIAVPSIYKEVHGLFHATMAKTELSYLKNIGGIGSNDRSMIVATATRLSYKNENIYTFRSNLTPLYFSTATRLFFKDN